MTTDAEKWRLLQAQVLIAGAHMEKLRPKNKPSAGDVKAARQTAASINRHVKAEKLKLRTP